MLSEKGNLLNSGIFKTTQDSEIARIAEVADWLMQTIEDIKNKYNDNDIRVAIEGVQYESNIGAVTFSILSRLQGALLYVLYKNKIETKICPTNSWRHHLGVKGKTRVDKKKSTRLIVKDKFKIDVEEDIADAIGVGHYGYHLFTSNK